MVVDDDPDIRESFSDGLAEEGWVVTCARDGAEALAALRDPVNRPELIFLALMMPGMNGYELREALSRDPALAPIPIVVITAASLPMPRAVRSVLRKPFRLDEALRLLQPQ